MALTPDINPTTLTVATPAPGTAPAPAAPGQPVAGPTTGDVLGAQNVQAQQARDTLVGNQLIGQAWQGLLTPPGQGGPEIPSNTPILSLPREQLDGIFGSDSSRLLELAGREPLTVGQGSALLGNSSIMELLEKRPDLNLSDLTNQGKGGLLPMLRDSETVKLLMDNSNINPRELASMQQMIMAHMPDPSLGKAAMRQAVEMVGSQDLKPQQVGELFAKIAGTVAGDPSAAPVALGMFRDAGEMMKGGLQPEQVGKLVQSASKIGGDGPSGANMIAAAFQEAGAFAQERPDVSADEIDALATTMSERFPGKGNPDRIAGFRMGMGLMAGNPNMGAKGIDTMLAQASEQGLKGDKLMKAFEGQTQAINAGTADLNVLTDPNAKPDAVGGMRFNRDGTVKEPQRPTPGQPTRPGQQPPGTRRQEGGAQGTGGPQGAGGGAQGAGGQQAAAGGAQGATEGAQGAGGQQGAADGAQGAAGGPQGATEGAQGEAGGAPGGAEGTTGATTGPAGVATGTEGQAAPGLSVAPPRL